MNAQYDKSADWQSPPEGYLAGISSQVHASRRRQSLRRNGLSLLLLFFSAGLGVWGIGRVAQPGAGNLLSIPCSIVQENHVAFLAGTLDVGLKAQIEAHLEKCVRCRAMLAEMQSSDARVTSAHGKTVGTRHPLLQSSSLLIAQQ